MTTTAVASTSTSASSQPNTSLYVRNLNTKTKKPELRKQLYSLFSTYGKVIDIVATRADGMRGRAFIVFLDLASATAARRALDGFEFYDRTISIDYAQTQSKATILLERGPEALFDASLLSSSSGPSSAATKGKVTFSSAQADQRGREKKRVREEARQRGEVVDADDAGSQEEEEDEDEDEGEKEEEEEDGHKAKLRKIDTSDGNEEQAKEEDDDEEETAMDMASSDSEDESSPGPAPPP